MTKRACLVVLWLGGAALAACGGGGGSAGDDGAEHPDAQPGSPSQLEACLAGGGALHQTTAPSNQHGAVISIAQRGDVVVLGSSDGSLKQWIIGTDGTPRTPLYGTPFQELSPREYHAIGMSADGRTFSGDDDGRIWEWNTDDSQPLRSFTMGTVKIVAVAVDPATGAAAVADTSSGGNLRIIATTGTTPGAALTTTLDDAGALAWGSGALFTAGAAGGDRPQVERRDAASPDAVVDTFLRTGNQALGPITGLALAPTGSALVAIGDGYVAVLDPADLAAGPKAEQLVAGYQLKGVVMLPGGTHFVTAGGDGKLRAWSVSPLAEAPALDIAAAIGIASDDAGNRLYTAGADGKLHVFECAP